MAINADKIAQQRELYGEPVGDLVRRACAALTLSQQQLARTLGLSPAMLSQLVTGHRIKMGNPLTLARLQAVLSLADEAPGLTRRSLEARLQEIARSHGNLSTSQPRAVSGPEGAEVVRRVLHAVASGHELEQAARLIEPGSPRLAEMLRVYGTDPAQKAIEHYDSIRHLMR